MSTLCALILTCLLIALVIFLYVDNYPWDIHVTSWKQSLKLNLPLCCFNTFTLNYCFELTLMQDLLMLVLKCYSWKVFALWFSCLLMSFTIALIAAFITCAYNSIDQDYDGMSLKKLSLLSFTYSGRVGTMLGDAWYVSNVSIISYVPCYFYDDTHMFYTHYMSLLCIFRH